MRDRLDAKTVCWQIRLGRDTKLFTCMAQRRNGRIAAPVIAWSQLIYIGQVGAN